MEGECAYDSVLTFISLNFFFFFFFFFFVHLGNNDLSWKLKRFFKNAPRSIRGAIFWN